MRTILARRLGAILAAQPIKTLKPVPLFAAQPTKVFRRSLFSKRLERSRIKFFAEAFFKKAGKRALAKATPAARRLSWLLLAEGTASEQVSCGLWAALL
ncbi:hypothetical protein FMM72_13200 [Anaerotruncus colihominis]|uniref:Uncharacterized protein n=1 Tax=Anaerotruncus colihominis TaxID=169435 RepID=A0A845T004_9FIRM|nr:hypothetical protein [Anaerotruncus colihominis]